MKPKNLHFLFLFYLVACAPLQDNPPTPHNYSSTSSQPVQPINQTPPNITNSTPPPPKEILLPSSDFAVYILDTDDKGTAIITLGHKSLLINANRDATRTLKIIRNLGIARLDYLILQNSQEANIAGAAPIILRAKPLEVIHTGIPADNNYYKNYNLLHPNSTIIPLDTSFQFSDSLISLIVPYDDGTPITSDSSIILKASYGNFNILFADDCGVDCESRISDSDIHANIVVSNGGCNSLSLLFLKYSSPDKIIFTGMPCEETLTRIAGLSIPFFVTSKDGDVVITSDGIKYNIQNSKT